MGTLKISARASSVGASPACPEHVEVARDFLFASRARSYSKNTRGFTLLELLVVMVIAGITLGLVSFKAMPDDRQVLQQDAQRIALLLQLARDEAIVRNRPIAFEADAKSYRFLIREEQIWQPLLKDEMLRERDFKHTPVSYAMMPSTALNTLPLRLIFGHEPVDKPFVLTLTVGEAHVAISADGIGHFVVE